MNKSLNYSPLSSVLKKIVDNRGKTVPTSKKGFPLIATNCVQLGSIYPIFEHVRYVDAHTLKTWFRDHLEPNDILFVNKGTPGRTCLVPEPVSFCIAQDMIALRCNEEEVDFRYLFMVLRSDFIQKKIANFHVGLVIPHFKKGDIDNILIPRLKTREEEELAGRLYFDLSAKIELNNKINTELEAFAKTIYDYWFVQFDFPDEYGKPYRSSGGKMVWNEKLMREIPKDWEVSRLKSLCSVIARGISPKYSNSQGILVLNQKCIRNGRVDFSLARRHETDKNAELKKNLEVLDVLINSTGVGTLGRVALIGYLEENVTTFDSHLTCVRANQKEIDKYYFGMTMLTKQTDIERFAMGSTGQVELSRYQLEEINILKPRMNIQELFAKIYASIILQISNNELQNRQLLKLRDWLLPMLMNGQVKVQD